jgi:hypothetical protein
MNNLFNQYDGELIENFELIFDRAKSEKIARENAVEYFLTLREEGKEADIEEIIDSAESYGYDLSDFETLIKQNE